MEYSATENSSDSEYSSYEDIIDLGKGKVQCTLCNVIVMDNENCIQRHIDGQKHDTLYQKRSALRNSIDYDDDYCRICNEYFGDISDHIETIPHKYEMDRLNSLIQGQYIELPNALKDEPTAKCTICKCKVCFHYHDLEVHIDGKKHRLARAISVQPENGIFNVTNDNGSLWCKICDCYFGNTVDDILDHVDNDENHEETLGAMEDLIEDEDIDMQKFLTDVSEDKAQCNKCKVHVPCCEYNLREHVEGNRHSCGN